MTYQEVCKIFRAAQMKKQAREEVTLYQGQPSSFAGQWASDNPNSARLVSAWQGVDVPGLAASAVRPWFSKPKEGQLIGATVPKKDKKYYKELAARVKSSAPWLALRQGLAAWFKRPAAPLVPYKPRQTPEYVYRPGVTQTGPYSPPDPTRTSASGQEYFRDGVTGRALK